LLISGLLMSDRDELLARRRRKNGLGEATAYLYKLTTKYKIYLRQWL
jgi:hypothetical protein